MMAFVSGVAVGRRAEALSSRTCRAQSSGFHGQRRGGGAAAAAGVWRGRGAGAGARMGYGDYGYLTDKTAGHTGQYYIDKFRTTADFGQKSMARTDADAMLGRTAKGRVVLPGGGIPQIADGPLARQPDAPPDPREAEAEGTVYPWDPDYVDPSFTAGLSDPDDEEVAENAFATFRGLLAAERGAALTTFDQELEHHLACIQEGFDESYLLSLEGKLDAEYARLQKIRNIMQFTPYGEPQTEIPGTPYVPSIGALDFMKRGNLPMTATIVGKEGKVGAFWKEEVKETPYVRPSGAEAPELPYNAAPSVPALAAGQVEDIVAQP